MNQGGTIDEEEDLELQKKINKMVREGKIIRIYDEKTKQFCYTSKKRYLEKFEK